MMGEVERSLQSVGGREEGRTPAACPVIHPSVAVKGAMNRFVEQGVHTVVGVGEEENSRQETPPLNMGNVPEQSHVGSGQNAQDAEIEDVRTFPGGSAHSASGRLSR